MTKKQLFFAIVEPQPISTKQRNVTQPKKTTSSPTPTFPSYIYVITISEKPFNPSALLREKLIFSGKRLKGLIFQPFKPFSSGPLPKACLRTDKAADWFSEGWGCLANPCFRGDRAAAEGFGATAEGFERFENQTLQPVFPENQWRKRGG